MIEDEHLLQEHIRNDLVVPPRRKPKGAWPKKKAKPHPDAWPIGTKVRFRSHPAVTTSLSWQRRVNIHFTCACWPLGQRDYTVAKKGGGKSRNLWKDDGSTRWDRSHAAAMERRRLA